VRPLKRLGQHFLTDRHILQRIVDALAPAPGDVVLEIGAGTGSLTDVLLAGGLQVIAIEKDHRLASTLRDARGEPRDAKNLAIVEGDALRLDLHALVRDHSHPASRIPRPGFSIIGNIPYAITTPLIDKALTPPLPARVVFLVQAEVAERLAAPPRSSAYGALSVGVQAVCSVERLFTVRAGAFTPPPKVQSAVVRLTPLAQPIVASDEIAAFRAFVTACFTRRRKQLRNVLIAATGRSAAIVTRGLEALGLDPAARPETLAPAEFVRLLRWSTRL
jgi:16S rRNA (adenine1518-N6/adenine1519-N6)-dimethyltransferase